MNRTERKPLIYLATILPIFLAGGIGLPALLTSLYAHGRSIAPTAIPNLNRILITLPAIFLWIPSTLLLANFVLFVVPPLRAIAESYASRAQRPGFYESQRQLGKVALLLVAICLPLISLGFIL